MKVLGLIIELVVEEVALHFIKEVEGVASHFIMVEEEVEGFAQGEEANKLVLVEVD